jgi:hypothetical protein
MAAALILQVDSQSTAGRKAMIAVHGACSIRGWRGACYWLGAVGLATAMLTITAMNRAAVADDEATQKDLPADLAAVPGNAVGFVSIRVGDVLQSPFLKAFRAKLAQEDAEAERAFDEELPKSFEAYFGVPLADAERLTLALLPPFNDFTNLQLIMTTAKPLDRAHVSAAKVTRAAGRQAVRFPNDHTLVVSVRELPSDAAGARRTSALVGALHEAAGKHAIVVGVIPSATIEQLAGEFLPADGAPILAMALVTHPVLLARSISLTLDADEIPRLQMRLAYRKEATAAVAEETLRSMIDIFGHWLVRQARTFERNTSGVIDAQLVHLLQSALQDMKIQQEGTDVRASLEVKGDLASAVLATTSRIRLARQRLISQNNLKQLALAMHNYESTYGRFPPAVVTSRDGKPLYSWRVAILPFIEEEKLWRDFKMDEPWDSENNKPLLARMPKTFAAPGVTEQDPSMTHYQVLVGGGALFEPNRAVRFPDITDGTSNTIMIVEAREAVPWSKPVDLTYNPQAPLLKFGGLFKGGFNVAAADGAVHFIPDNTDPTLLRALISRAGGEVTSWPGEDRSGLDRGSSRARPKGISSPTETKKAYSVPPKLKEFEKSK